VRLLPLSLVVLAGCGACGTSTPAGSEFWGPQPQPPLGLTKIHPGMTAAEAKKLVPELKEPARKGIRDELVLDSGYNDVTLEVRLDNGAVAALVAIVQGHTAREMLENAWGKPQITKDPLNQQEVTWASESSGWKVKLDCLERNCFVEFFPYQVLTNEFFGGHVVPPGDLAKLKDGMRLAQAKQLAPGPVSVRNGVATEFDGVKEYVTIDDRSATVKEIYVNLPPHAEELITESWGPGKEAKLDNKSVLVWLDPETHWRAWLRPAVGSSHDLVYDNYLPAAQLLGDQPDRLDGLPEPVLGKTAAEVQHAYKDEVAVVTPNRELELRMPRTEWGDSYGTRIELALAGGKVKELAFDLPWKPNPTDAHDTLRDVFVHKWGDPKEIEEQGKKLLLFHDDDPRVEVFEDTDRGAWHVTLK
jgi:hypothetical protein